MDINIDHCVMGPWFNPFQQVTCTPYMPSSVPAQYTHYDNHVSLRFDQSHNLLHRTRVQGAILKPKAIRISNIHPLVFPKFSESQPRFGSHFQEFRGHNDNITHHFGFKPRSIHDVGAHLNGFHQYFPFLSPCPYVINSPASTIDIEFKDMLHSQKRLLHFYEASDNKHHEESHFGADITVLRPSEIYLPTAANSLNQNFGHSERAIVSPQSTEQKYIAFPIKIIPNDNRIISKLNESKRKHACVQKLKHKALKNSRKRFNSSFVRTIKHDTFSKEEPLKEESKSHSPNKVKKYKNMSDDLSSQKCSQEENISLESSRSFQKNNGASIPKHSLDSNDVSSKSSLAKSVSIEDNRTKVVGDRMLYSPQPSFSEDRKTFKCPQCRYLTDRKNNLKRHIVTMHQDSGKTLECCGVSFQNKAALRDHNAIFHRGGYRCQVCSRNFCRKALLRRHLTVHSGQKDFFCNICGYATSHKSNLERHQKVHTKREANSGTSRKGVSMKMGLRLQTTSSFSGLDFGQHRRYGTTEASSTLPGYKSSECESSFKQSSHPGNSCHIGQSTITSFSNKQIKAFYRANLQNLKNRSLHNNKVNTLEKCVFGSKDMRNERVMNEDAEPVGVNLECRQNVHKTTTKCVSKFHPEKLSGKNTGCHLFMEDSGGKAEESGHLSEGDERKYEKCGLFLEDGDRKSESFTETLKRHRYFPKRKAEKPEDIQVFSEDNETQKKRRCFLEHSIYTEACRRFPQANNENSWKCRLLPTSEECRHFPEENDGKLERNVEDPEECRFIPEASTRNSWKCRLFPDGNAQPHILVNCLDGIQTSFNEDCKKPPAQLPTIVRSKLLSESSHTLPKKISKILEPSRHDSCSKYNQKMQMFNLAYTCFECNQKFLAQSSLGSHACQQPPHPLPVDVSIVDILKKGIVDGSVIDSTNDL